MDGSSGKKNTPFLIISGHISGNKKKEFEHTFRIGFSALSRDCISSHLSEDKNEEGLYHFFSCWASEASMEKFMDSPEYQLLSGAFHALGDVTQTMNGVVQGRDRQVSTGHV